MHEAILQDEGMMAGKKPTPIIRDAEQLLRRGIDALEHDRFEEAAGLLQQAAELAPQASLAFLALGIALGRLLRINDAFEALETAAELDPVGFYPRFRLAELYMRLGLPLQGEEYLQRAMDLSTSDQQRRMIRELRASDRKRSPKRVWRPDFGRFWRAPKVKS